MLRRISCFLLLTFSVSVFSQNGIPGLTTNTLQPLPTNLPMDLIQTMGEYVQQNYSNIQSNTNVVLSSPGAPLSSFVISPTSDGFTIFNIIRKANAVTPQIVYGFTNTNEGAVVTSVGFQGGELNTPNILTFSNLQLPNGIAITSTPSNGTKIQTSSLEAQLDSTTSRDGSNFVYSRLDITTPDGVLLQSIPLNPYSPQNSANLLVFRAQASNKTTAIDEVSAVDASRSDRPITQDASGITNVMNGHE